jgi:hypothetical protein
MEGIEPAPRLLSGPELRAGSLFRHHLRSAIGYEPSGGPPRWIFDLIKPVAVPSRPSSWGDWPQLGQHRDLAALLGVGLVVATPRGAERLRAAGFTDVAPLEGGDFVLQQPAVPRARIVHRARRATSDADSLEQTIAHAREAVVSAVVGPDASSLDLAEPPPGAREEARIVLDEPERVAIEAELAAPGLLVLTDTWVRGWSATVDGAEQPVLRVDHAFRGIALGPGHHRVVFLYRPRAIVAGAWLSFAALVLAIAMIGAGRGSRDS